MASQTYSYSRLTTYENCPLSFKFRYIDREKPGFIQEGIEAFMGKRVHETLQKLYDDLKLEKRNSLDSLLETYSELWKKEWSDDVVVVKPSLKPENYFLTGSRCISDYYKRYQPFNQDKTIATEAIIRINLGEVALRGFIDRLSEKEDGHYQIHDYKTGGYFPQMQKFDQDRQLALYQIGVADSYPNVKKVTLVWHYLAFDKEVRLEKTTQQLEELKQGICSLVEEIESTKEFLPKESTLCDWCEFQHLCPRKKHEVKVSPLPPNKYLSEPGVKLVNEYAKLKLKEGELQEEIDLLKEALLSYAEREGVDRIQGSDAAAGVYKTRYPKFSPEAEALLKKEGLWEDFSKLDANALDKALPRLERALAERLKKLEDVSESRYVRLLKKG